MLIDLREVKSIRQEGVKWLLGDGIFTTGTALSSV